MSYRSTTSVKSDILCKFMRMGARAGQVLPNEWIEHEYKAVLRRCELGLLKTAVNELANEGLVELRNYYGFTAIALTSKGERLIG